MKKLFEVIKRFFLTNTKMKLLVAYIVANLLYILIGSYIFMTGNITRNFTYQMFSRGLKNIGVLNFIVFLVICFEKKYKKKTVHFMLIPIVIFGAISVHFAFNKDTALYGAPMRFEGFFCILYYLSVFLLCTFFDDKYKKFLVHCILICGMCNAVYGICQCFQVPGVRVYWHSYKMIDEVTQEVIRGKMLWVLGFTSNPNFFGAYMLLCVSYSIGLFLNKNTIIGNIIYCVGIAVFMFGILICNTSSSVVGLFVVVFGIIVYCIKNKLIKKLLLVIGILVATTIFAVNIGKTKFLRDTGLLFFQAGEITKGKMDDSFGTNRMFIWKETVKVIPEHYWHGVGIDGFQYAFNGKPLTRNGKIYDKAHSEILQVLITQGIFALISYMIFYGYIIIFGIWRSFKHKEVYLALPVIGYLVQAMFNISVIEVAPVFFIALGLCSCRNVKNKEIEPEKLKNSNQTIDKSVKMV